jgi:hypothetical protein
MTTAKGSKKEFCEACGASKMQYRHSFSEALATGLLRLYKFGQPAINLKYLKLTRNQWDNFQKLRYWELVKKHTDENSKRIGGTWAITDLGRKFVEGACAVHKTVWTYRGCFVRYDGPMVYFSELHDGYKTREQYADEAIPHGDIEEGGSPLGM